uniref:Uncharacterized protein n=1 Tax=Castor canadensis TaxID=51338 RepID=A0A8C0W7T2_CASCN
MQKEQHGVAMQGGPHDSAPVTTRTTMINRPRDTSLPDHMVWSLFNTLFVNCCLGFIPWRCKYSMDRKMVGDVTGAQAYASADKCLKVSALVFSIPMGALIIIPSYN